MDKIDDCDFLMLGSGVGGKLLAWTLASDGKRLAMIERKYIGGSCPNIAGLPSKNVVHSAKVASYFHRRTPLRTPPVKSSRTPDVSAGAPATLTDTVTAAVPGGIDPVLANNTASVSAAGAASASGSVAGRYAFYFNIAFVGGVPLAVPTTADFAAIAPDKVALMPGQTADYENYTNSNSGINCISIGRRSPLAAFPWPAFIRGRRKGIMGSKKSPAFASRVVTAEVAATLFLIPFAGEKESRR